MAHKRKPAAFLTIFPHKYRYSPGISPTITPELSDVFFSTLENFGLQWSQSGYETFEDEVGGKIVTFEQKQFAVGTSKENLECLTRAKTDATQGLALGYPEESVRYFEKTFHDDLPIGDMYRDHISKAKQAGIEAPSWLAYIFHIPSPFNLFTGDICKESKEMGMRNQELVRMHDPEFALKFERYKMR